VHFHDLRHTGNTLTAAAGANLRELMARMGHSSTRAALIYLHAPDERQRKIADALGELAAKELKRQRSGTQRARRRCGASCGSLRTARTAPLVCCYTEVELRGLEPLTPCLQSRCSSS